MKRLLTGLLALALAASLTACGRERTFRNYRRGCYRGC